MTEPSAMIALQEAARVAGVCPRQFRRLVAAGVLPPSTKALGRPLWHRPSLLEALARLVPSADKGAKVAPSEDASIEFG